MTMDTEEDKFGVIVCSRCHTAKTIDLVQDNKTTGCHQCGKRLDTDRVKIHYRCDSREEASWAVGQLNAKMNDGTLPEKEEELDEEKDPHAKACQKAEIASDEKERLLIICRTLGEETGAFEIEDVEKVYSMIGRDREDLKEKVKRLEEIYEPREGVFRVV